MAFSNSTSDPFPRSKDRAHVAPLPRRVRSGAHIVYQSQTRDNESEKF